MITINLLDIFSKISFVNTSIGPDVSSVSAFLIVWVGSNVNISIYFSRFPTTVSMSHSFIKISLKHWCISPSIFSLSVEFSFSIFSFIFVSINENFNTISIFNWFYKSSFIVLFFWELQNPKSIFLAILPFTLINNFSCCVIVYTLTIFDSLNPLPIVNVSVSCFQDSRSMFLTVHELAFINVLFGNNFNTISSLFSRSIFFAFPSSDIKFAIIVP